MEGLSIPGQPPAVVTQPNLPFPPRSRQLRKAVPIAAVSLLIGLFATWWASTVMTGDDGRPWYLLILVGASGLALALSALTRGSRPLLRGVWWSTSYVFAVHRESVRSGELPQDPLVRLAVAALACSQLEGVASAVTMVVSAVFGMLLVPGGQFTVLFLGWIALAAIPLYRAVRAWKYLGMYEAALPAATT